MLFLRFEDGIIATLNPRDWASASRCSMRLIDLTSPASPTSPHSTVLLFTGLSIVLDAIEEIIERSRAGSSTFRPPTKFTNTSFDPIASPILFSRTAINIPKRL